MEVWSSNRRWGGTGPGASGEVWKEGLLIVTLVAIRKGVHMCVVEKALVAISPRETLWEWNHETTHKSECGTSEGQSGTWIKEVL